MNIEDFVSESLRQIGAGVSKVAKHNGIDVYPRANGGAETMAAAGHLRGEGRVIVQVEFDLSVTVQSKWEGNIEGGLTILGIGGKADTNTGIDQTRVQRVKFHVPVILKPISGSK